jgi:hypothetical protein
MRATHDHPTLYANALALTNTACCALLLLLLTIAFFFFFTKNIHATLFATSICGANVCKWALCTTTSFWLCCCMGCIRHVNVPGQQSMATMGGCASFSRALGVSQILVLQEVAHDG